MLLVLSAWASDPVADLEARIRTLPVLAGPADPAHASREEMDAALVEQLASLKARLEEMDRATDGAPPPLRVSLLERVGEAHLLAARRIRESWVPTWLTEEQVEIYRYGLEDLAVGMEVLARERFSAALDASEPGEPSRAPDSPVVFTAPRDRDAERAWAMYLAHEWQGEASLERFVARYSCILRRPRPGPAWLAWRTRLQAAAGELPACVPEETRALLASYEPSDVELDRMVLDEYRLLAEVATEACGSPTPPELTALATLLAAQPPYEAPPKPGPPPPGPPPAYTLRPLRAPGPDFGAWLEAWRASFGGPPGAPLTREAWGTRVRLPLDTLARLPAPTDDAGRVTRALAWADAGEAVLRVPTPRLEPILNDLTPLRWRMAVAWEALDRAQEQVEPLLSPIETRSVASGDRLAAEAAQRRISELRVRVLARVGG